MSGHGSLVKEANCRRGVKQPQGGELVVWIGGRMSVPRGQPWAYGLFGFHSRACAYALNVWEGFIRVTSAL